MTNVRKDVFPGVSAISRTVAFFVYPGFVLLDLSGPLEAFAAAESAAPGTYRLVVLSLSGGEVASSTGLPVATGTASEGSFDTLVVVGDFSLAHATADRVAVEWIRRASGRARRTASVCMGAFLLAASGLLDERQATTHWLYAQALRSRFPAIKVDGDRLFISDGKIWTSAGMTAGIDMALAMIEDDLGLEASKAVARTLVVHHRRLGGQYQHSSLLDLDPGSDRIREVLRYARDHLKDALTVEGLSVVARLSVRQFSRSFLAATGITPAKAIERLRVEAARPRVEDGREPLNAIAEATGFNDSERMCQSFLRVLGQTPQSLRRSFRATSPDEA